MLFCLADDAGMHFGAYGCRWVKTPGFDRVAREGVLFTNAYTPNAKCAPARACILTGRNSWQLGDAANHQCFFPAEFSTCFEVLRDHGYFVGHTAKGWAPGDPGTVNGKPRELTGPAFNSQKLTPATSDINDCDYAGNFEAFLNEKPADKPFCFWYGATEPHRGYEYGSGAEKGGKRTSDIDHVYNIWPDTEVVRNDLLDYGFEIEHFDQHVGRMLAMLEERGELENTIVVVTSDNGMPFPRAKGQEYEYSNHLPLAIMWPEGIRNPGRTVDDYVSFIDFAPTFLELAGINEEDTDMQPITGKSLTDILYTPEDGMVSDDRDHVLIGKERHDVGRPGNKGYPIRGIFKGGYLYLRNYAPDRWPAGNPETGYLNTDGSPTKTEVLRTRHDPEQRRYWELAFGKRPEEELYDVVSDPDCIENLADHADYSCKKERLREQLVFELEQQGDPRITGGQEPLDENPPANLNGDDFYERFTAGELPVPGWIRASDIEEADCT